MKEIRTCGDICLDDEYGFTYKVADITYTEREDESFRYEIAPNYSVISLLSSLYFQGIPGIDLDLKKKVYIRENVIPVFISERTPGNNRENFWELLKDCEMEYPNPLEWLIRTKTRYPGDSLYVKRPEDRTIDVDSINSLGDRSAVICRRIIESISYGNNVNTSTVCVNDSNRNQIYELLIALYRTERKFLDSQRRNGIAKSAKEGNYKGRKRIKIDTLAALEIYSDYAANLISSKEAADKLKISKSTFFRRYNEYTGEKECESG